MNPPNIWTALFGKEPHKEKPPRLKCSKMPRIWRTNLLEWVLSISWDYWFYIEKVPHNSNYERVQRIERLFLRAKLILRLASGLNIHHRCLVINLLICIKLQCFCNHPAKCTVLVIQLFLQYCTQPQEDRTYALPQINLYLSTTHVRSYFSQPESPYFQEFCLWRPKNCFQFFFFLI